MNKRPHYAGTDHVIPLEGTAGHARVVARGCQGAEDGGYFSVGDEGCALGYTWDCSDCPALPEPTRVHFEMSRLHDERDTDPLRREVPYV